MKTRHPVASSGKKRALIVMADWFIIIIRLNPQTAHFITIIAIGNTIIIEWRIGIDLISAKMINKLLLSGFLSF